LELVGSLSYQSPPSHDQVFSHTRTVKPLVTEHWWDRTGGCPLAGGWGSHLPATQLRERGPHWGIIKWVELPAAVSGGAQSFTVL